VCIIGCGVVAGINDTLTSTLSVSHAHAISKHSNYLLHGCFDIDPEKMKMFAEKWNCQNTYPTMQAALDDNNDIFVIASDTNSHAEIINLLLHSNCESIICEKPIFATLSELLSFKELLLKSRKKIIVNFFRRFDIAHNQIRKCIASKELGNFMAFNAMVGKGMLHNGSHLIDLLLFLFGRVKDLKGVNIESSENDSYGIFKVQAADVIGSVNCIKDCAYSLFELDLLFANGRIQLKDIGYKIEIYSPQTWQAYPGFKRLELVTELQSTLGQAFYDMYDLHSQHQIDYTDNLVQALIGAELLLNFQEQQVLQEEEFQTENRS
jgi:predicted dehydrogenase